MLIENKRRQHGDRVKYEKEHGKDKSTDQLQVHTHPSLPSVLSPLAGLAHPPRYLVVCSFLEIYNERIYDLLDAESSGLQLREDVKNGVMVQGLTEVTVETPYDALQVWKDEGKQE